MITKNCCGNCRHWVDTWTTLKGHLPYYGKCAKGRPIIKERKGIKTCEFKLRCDPACKEWEAIV